MRHKSCTHFSFFPIIRQNAVKDGFWYPVLSAIILQLARRLSFKTAATRAMFSLFPAFHSALHLQLIPYLPQTGYAIEIPRFYKHFPLFRSCKSRFTIKWHVQNFLPWYFISRVWNIHTILQNALILPHIDGLTSNLARRWRIVWVTISQIFITIAPLVPIFQAQSQNLRDVLCTSFGMWACFRKRLEIKTDWFLGRSSSIIGAFGDGIKLPERRKRFCHNRDSFCAQVSKTIQ